jgi:CheY-like chemotaxis protein
VLGRAPIAVIPAGRARIVAILVVTAETVLMAVILIVEDDMFLRDDAEMMIQDWGHDTLSASDVDEALSLLHSPQQIDALFTDIYLKTAVLGGYEVAHQAIKLRLNLRVLYTTKNAKFPVKFPVSREFAWRRVRSTLRRQPASPGLGDFGVSNARKDRQWRGFEGLAVGGLWPRFNPNRSNLAHTALRLCPSRMAICPALWPLAQKFLRSATLAASHMRIAIHPKVGLGRIQPQKLACAFSSPIKLVLNENSQICSRGNPDLAAFASANLASKRS